LSSLQSNMPKNSFNGFVAPNPLVLTNLIVTGSASIQDLSVGIIDGSGGGGGGNIGDWATCNAVTNVNIAGFNLNNVGTASINTISSAQFNTVSGAVYSLSGYTYSTVGNLSTAVYSLSSTVNNLSGVVRSVSGAVHSLSSYTYSTVGNLSSTVHNLSGYTYTSISTLSSKITNFSTSLTTVTLNVCGLATLSGLIVNNSASIQNLSVGRINGYAYPNIFFEGFGTNIIRVDVNGSDTIASANKYIYPFQTISAALGNASTGDEVFVCPGTYNQSSRLVIPAGVSLRGANTQGVQIQNTAATTSFTLVEMLSNTRIEDVTLTLTSSTTTVCGAQYVVVAMSGTNIPSLKLRTMVMNANNFNKGGNVYGIYASGNANTDITIALSSTTVRGTTINVTTSGQTNGTFLGSNARCIYSSGSNRVSIRDTNCFLIGSNCSGAKLIACETTVSGSRMDLTASIISARSLGTTTNCSLAEISQTSSNSVIELGATHLLGHSANGLGFSTIQLGTNFIYGVYQTTSWNTGDFNMTGYMFPGTALRSAVEATSTTDAVPYTIPQDCILNRVLLRVNPVAVLGTNGSPIMHVKIFLNENFVTPIVTLSLTGTTRVFSNFNYSRALLKDDRVYVNLSNVGAGGGASNVTGLYSATVDFELY
jgi:hypothetical protein